jgi:hypothetical protein
LVGSDLLEHMWQQNLVLVDGIFLRSPHVSMKRGSQ